MQVRQGTFADHVTEIPIYDCTLLGDSMYCYEAEDHRVGKQCPL